MTKVILMLAIALAACKGKKSDEAVQEKATGAAATVSAEDRALLDRWSGLYGEYAAALEGAGVDCAKAAAAVRGVNAKNADLIAKGKPRLAALRGDPAAARWMDETYKPKLGAALDRMAPLLDSCRGNAEVSAALEEGPFSRKDQPR
jgi:hypothetical protein